MAKQCRVAQLLHQRHGEFVEGVRQNHHLKTLTQPVQKFPGTGQRVQLTDHFLDLRQAIAVLVQQFQALLHQDIVIRNVAGGGLELINAGFFGERDPDFRDQYSFKVKACEFHNGLLIDWSRQQR